MVFSLSSRMIGAIVHTWKEGGPDFRKNVGGSGIEKERERTYQGRSWGHFSKNQV